MYQLQVTVHEYIGCVGVRGSLVDVDEYGRVVPLAAMPERLFDSEGLEDDGLRLVLAAVVKWARCPD